MIRLYFITVLRQPELVGIVLLRFTDQAYTIQGDGLHTSKWMALPEARALAYHMGVELQVVVTDPGDDVINSTAEEINPAKVWDCWVHGQTPRAQPPCCHHATAKEGDHS